MTFGNSGLGVFLALVRAAFSLIMYSYVIRRTWNWSIRSWGCRAFRNHCIPVSTHLEPPSWIRGSSLSELSRLHSAKTVKYIQWSLASFRMSCAQIRIYFESHVGHMMFWCSHLGVFLALVRLDWFRCRQDSCCRSHISTSSTENQRSILS